MAGMLRCAAFQFFIEIIILLKVGVGYTEVKNTFVLLLFKQIFCIPFTLSQYGITKFSAFGPGKKCRAKIQDGHCFHQK